MLKGFRAFELQMIIPFNTIPYRNRTETPKGYAQMWVCLSNETIPYYNYTDSHEGYT